MHRKSQRKALQLGNQLSAPIAAGQGITAKLHVYHSRLRLFNHPFQEVQWEDKILLVGVEGLAQGLLEDAASPWLCAGRRRLRVQ